MATRKSSRKNKAPPRPVLDVTALISRSEVVGVILVFLSAITLLSLLTSSNGVLTHTWLSWLEMLFGRGLWGFPLVTGALGMWMIIRAIENLPDLPWQRPAGMGLLFLSYIMAATLWEQTSLEPAGGQVGLLLVSLVASAIGL